MLVDGGHYPDLVTDKAGYGLAQWTFWSRKQALLDYAREHKKSIGDLQMQLDFLWKELNESYPAVLTVLKSADSVKDLRIRKGNGTDTAWTGKYVPPGTYTIVEVKAGKGSAAGWGRLKSGAGWIALSFCKRV